MGDQIRSTGVCHVTYLFALASSHNGVNQEQASSRTEHDINILGKDLIKCLEQPTVICISELSGMEGKLPTRRALADKEACWFKKILICLSRCRWKKKPKIYLSKSGEFYPTCLKNNYVTQTKIFCSDVM